MSKNKAGQLPDSGQAERDEAFRQRQRQALRKALPRLSGEERKARTMVITGEVDYRVLKVLDVEAVVARIPGEPLGLRRRPNHWLSKRRTFRAGLTSINAVEKFKRVRLDNS